MIEVKGCFHTDDGRVDNLVSDQPTLDEAASYWNDNPNGFVWVALFDPTAEEMADVGRAFGLSQLEMDDALNPRQRTKLELSEGSSFVVLKLLSWVDETLDIETGQLSLFIASGYIITVQLDAPGDLNWALDQLSGSQELVEHGAVSVLHALVDRAVDDYVAVTDEVTAVVEAIEVSVFSDERTNDSETIYKLKRENLEIRRAVTPLVPGASTLARNQQTRLPAQLVPYFRDIADHVLRVADGVESNDSLLVTMLMASTARLDLQQNADMRRISAWVAIAAVPTAIAAIYGMNFDDMPELHWKFGYPAVLLVMAAACSFLYYKFRKSGWL